MARFTARILSLSLVLLAVSSLQVQAEFKVRREVFANVVAA